MTAVARVRAAYARIADVDRPEVWIALRAEADVVRDAEAVDARVAAGEHLPLAGRTLAVKDNIDVAGLPTTPGCPAYASAPGTTAPAVQRLLDAGCVLLGKTNLDQFATGLVGARSPYGAVRDAWRPAFVSGGSSSGSGVAVALGIADVALGTDTAGSGRIPAAFGGIVGVKPTRGLVPLTGVVPACRTLDVVTTLARSLGEAELAAQVMAVTTGTIPAAAPGRPTPPSARRRGRGSASRSRASSRRSPRRPAPRSPRRPSGCARPGPPSRRSTWPACSTRARCSTAARSSPSASPRSARSSRPIPTRSTRPSAGSSPRPPCRRRASSSPTRSASTASGSRPARCSRASTRSCCPPRSPSRRSPPWRRIPSGANAALGRYVNGANLLDLSAVAVPAGEADGGRFGVMTYAPAFHDRVAADVAGLVVGADAGAVPPATWLGPPGVELLVVGAHLSGQPLNGQLTDRGGRLVRAVRTSADYRLHALATDPPKPGLVRVADGAGAPIAGEVWALPAAGLGTFLAALPAPMALGSVRLEDGTAVTGFLCEPAALDGAPDITVSGGWLAHLAAGSS